MNILSTASVKNSERSEFFRRIVTRVADNTIAINNKAFKNWEFAPVINGLIALGGDKYCAAAKDIVDLGISLQNKEGQLAFGLNIVAGDPGNAVERWTGAKTITGTLHSSSYGPGTLHFHKLGGNPRYLEAAHRQYEYVKTVRRTSDGGFVHREETTELWLDTVWFTVPFLAEYGQVANEPAAFDEAVKQVRVHAKRLCDPTAGLYRHIWSEHPNSFPQSSFWSRGQGWIAGALVDAYPFLPKGHPGREELAQILGQLVEALLPFQDTSGFWHNIIDDPRSPLESSGSLMFAYALRKGLDLGMLSDRRYASIAEAAMNAVCEAVYADGSVGLVSLPPGGPNAKFGHAPYGQGWFLLAGSRFLQS